jgi:hypothetical protein
MALFELAQLNLAIPKHSLDSPQMAEFTDNIDKLSLTPDGEEFPAVAAGYVRRSNG